MNVGVIYGHVPQTIDECRCYMMGMFHKLLMNVGVIWWTCYTNYWRMYVLYVGVYDRDAPQISDECGCLWSACPTNYWWM